MAVIWAPVVIHSWCAGCSPLSVGGGKEDGGSVRNKVLRLQTIKAIVDSRSFKSPKSDEPRRVQVLDLYCLTRFESEGSSKGSVY